VTYNIQLAQEAEKDLERLDRATLLRVQKRIDELILDPYSPRLLKPLAMGPGRRSARAGDWRIIYSVDDMAEMIIILGVKHRTKAYKKMT
jgi:mRNA-degrading endonuclease RelE of RelBE toxin-antitoxin system